MSFAEQLYNLIVWLAAIAASVTVLIDQLKPFVFDPILQKNGEQPYLAAIFITRTTLSFLGVLILGGASAIFGLVPNWVGVVPEVGVLVVATLLTTSGTGFLHAVQDWLTQLRQPVATVEAVDLTSVMDTLAKSATPTQSASINVTAEVTSTEETTDSNKTTGETLELTHG